MRYGPGILRKSALSLPRVAASREATGGSGADITGIRAVNIGHFTRDRLTAILGELGQEVELAVSVKPYYPFRRSSLPSRVIELFEVFSLLNRPKQQHHSHGDDPRQNTKAREEAEALFRPKHRVIEPSTPTDPTLAGAASRRPRVLSALVPSFGGESVRALIGSELQIRPAVSVSPLLPLQQERERLHNRRVTIINQQQQLQTKLDEINNEMRAIDAYEAAKNSKSLRPRRSSKTPRGTGSERLKRRAM